VTSATRDPVWIVTPAARALVQLAIEEPPVDHERFDLRGRVADRRAARRVKADVRERVQDGVTRDVELVERLRREHPGAMDRLARRMVLFVQRDVETAERQEPCRMETGGPSANHDHVTHLCRNHNVLTRVPPEGGNHAVPPEGGNYTGPARRSAERDDAWFPASAGTA
jgi:hypothetical protein